MSTSEANPRPRRRARSLAGIAALAVGGLLLTSCAASEPAADPASYVFTKGDDVVEIEFWSAAVEGLNQKLVDTFNSTRGAELGIHVNVSYQGSYSEAEQKVYAAQLANTLPNVYVGEASMTEAFVDGGAALDLDPYAEANDLDIDDFEIGEIGYLYSDEQLRAFPYMRSVPLMYVNRGLLAESGFNPDGPKSLEELDEVLRTISAKTGKPALPLVMTTWFIEPFLYSAANLPLTGEDGSSNIAEPGSVEFAEWVQSLVDAGAIRHIPRGESKEFTAALVDPNTAVSFYSSGGIQTLQSLAAEKGIDLGVAMFPSGEDGSRGVAVGGSNLYLAPTGTDEQKAASFEFSRWLTDTEQAASVSAASGYIAVRKSSQETETLKAVAAKNPAYAVAAEQLTYAKARPLSPRFTEIESLVGERYDTMLSQKQDPAKALKALADEINRIAAR